MAMAEAQIAKLKVIVAAQFFSSCYFKVQLLHTVTLISKKRLKTNLETFFCHLVDYCVDSTDKPSHMSRSAVHVTTDLTRAEYSEGCHRLLSTHKAPARLV